MVKDLQDYVLLIQLQMIQMRVNMMVLVFIVQCHVILAQAQVALTQY